ncbi:MAG: hypothetical protein KatS3mg078_1635 [Deltaproteobacteria bacterium]|jgi:hypothetical protein|nr:MAG: hypothetical protein KatS3mg078_1635 [Deltaproteobacteria bacterium]
MARASLIVYQPIDVFKEKKEYWKRYINFYEQYWGGPTSPYGVWFGTEYQTFRKALSHHLGIDEDEIEDCFFMKDERGNYYIVSLRASEKESQVLYSENYIPLYWFVPFKDEEKRSFYTPWGFGSISYHTKIALAIDRLEEAKGIVKGVIGASDDAVDPFVLPVLKDMDSGIGYLKSWLYDFDSSGYLVLNYGEICSFIHPSMIQNERSVKDIWEALYLLREGDTKGAQLKLQVLIEKWSDIKRRASGEIDSKFTIQ